MTVSKRQVLKAALAAAVAVATPGSRLLAAGIEGGAVKTGPSGPSQAFTEAVWIEIHHPPKKKAASPRVSAKSRLIRDRAKAAPRKTR